MSSSGVVVFGPLVVFCPNVLICLRTVSLVLLSQSHIYLVSLPLHAVTNWATALSKHRQQPEELVSPQNLKPIFFPAKFALPFTQYHIRSTGLGFGCFAYFRVCLLSSCLWKPARCGT